VSTDNQIEQEIQAKGLTAPRITPADIEANIDQIEIVKFVSSSGQVLRWAVITSENGYAVTGKPSCSVSSANDNAEIGEKIAIENAKGELWPLMGYELKSKLRRESRGDVNSYQAEQLLWHAEMKNQLLDLLQISDPSNIVKHVARLKAKA